MRFLFITRKHVSGVKITEIIFAFQSQSPYVCGTYRTGHGVIADLPAVNMYNQHQQWGYGGGGPPMQPYFPPFPPGGGGGPNHFYGGGVPPYPHYEEGGGPPYPHFGGVEGANFGGEGPSHFGGGGGGPRFGPRGPMGGGGPRFTADGRPWAEDPPHYVFPGKHTSP
jgi:hypothetical protein